MFHYYRKSNFTIKVIALAIIFVFAFSSLCPSYALAQSVSGLPMPGTMVSLSPVFTPTILRGLRVYPDNSLKFDFIVDSGDTGLKGAALKNESERLIKYFLAALTIPEDNLWVNLSPHEQDRVIPDTLAQTDMGTDMLAQDYLLKQVTASLIYPEDELGKQFWQKIYKKAYEEYGTTNIPVDTFNKVWIMPERAEVYVKDDRAFVVESRLKVMLEEDYVALQAKQQVNSEKLLVNSKKTQNTTDHSQNTVSNNKLASDIVREIVIPALEKEVNEGKNFAQLRQIYNSLILAYWFKNNLKESILNRVYSDQSKIKGVDTKDISQDIYNQYIDSFKKGVCDFIKVEYDQYARKNIPRKYFSGGVVGRFAPENVEILHADTKRGQRAGSAIGNILKKSALVVLVSVGLSLMGPKSFAQTDESFGLISSSETPIEYNGDFYGEATVPFESQLLVDTIIGGLDPIDTGSIVSSQKILLRGEEVNVIFTKEEKGIFAKMVDGQIQVYLGSIIRKVQQAIDSISSKGNFLEGVIDSKELSQMSTHELGFNLSLDLMRLVLIHEVTHQRRFQEEGFSGDQIGRLNSLFRKFNVPKEIYENTFFELEGYLSMLCSGSHAKLFFSKILLMEARAEAGSSEPYVSKMISRKVLDKLGYRSFIRQKYPERIKDFKSGMIYYDLDLIRGFLVFFTDEEIKRSAVYFYERIFLQKPITNIDFEADLVKEYIEEVFKKTKDDKRNVGSSAINGRGRNPKTHKEFEEYYEKGEQDELFMIYDNGHGFNNVLEEAKGASPLLVKEEDFARIVNQFNEEVVDLGISLKLLEEETESWFYLEVQKDKEFIGTMDVLAKESGDLEIQTIILYSQRKGIGTVIFKTLNKFLGLHNNGVVEAGGVLDAVHEVGYEGPPVRKLENMMKKLVDEGLAEPFTNERGEETYRMFPHGSSAINMKESEMWDLGFLVCGLKNLKMIGMKSGGRQYISFFQDSRKGESVGNIYGVYEDGQLKLRGIWIEPHFKEQYRKYNLSVMMISAFLKLHPEAIIAEAPIWVVLLNLLLQEKFGFQPVNPNDDNIVFIGKTKVDISGKKKIPIYFNNSALGAELEESDKLKVFEIHMEPLKESATRVYVNTAYRLKDQSKLDRQILEFEKRFDGQNPALIDFSSQKKQEPLSEENAFDQIFPFIEKYLDVEKYLDYEAHPFLIRDAIKELGEKSEKLSQDDANEIKAILRGVIENYSNYRDNWAVVAAVDVLSSLNDDEDLKLFLRIARNQAGELGVIREEAVLVLGKYLPSDEIDGVLKNIININSYKKRIVKDALNTFVQMRKKEAAPFLVDLLFRITKGILVGGSPGERFSATNSNQEISEIIVKQLKMVGDEKTKSLLKSFLEDDTKLPKKRTIYRYTQTTGLGDPFESFEYTSKEKMFSAHGTTQFIGSKISGQSVGREDKLIYEIINDPNPLYDMVQETIKVIEDRLKKESGSSSIIFSKTKRKEFNIDKMNLTTQAQGNGTVPINSFWKQIRDDKQEYSSDDRVFVYDLVDGLLYHLMTNAMNRGGDKNAKMTISFYSDPLKEKSRILKAEIVQEDISDEDWEVMNSNHQKWQEGQDAGIDYLMDENLRREDGNLKKYGDAFSFLGLKMKKNPVYLEYKRGKSENGKTPLTTTILIKSELLSSKISSPHRNVKNVPFQDKGDGDLFVRKLSDMKRVKEVLSKPVVAVKENQGQANQGFTPMTSEEEFLYCHAILIRNKETNKHVFLHLEKGLEETASEVWARIHKTQTQETVKNQKYGDLSLSEFIEYLGDGEKEAIYLTNNAEAAKKSEKYLAKEFNIQTARFIEIFGRKFFGWNIIFQPKMNEIIIYKINEAYAFDAFPASLSIEKKSSSNAVTAKKQQSARENVILQTEDLIVYVDSFGKKRISMDSLSESPTKIFLKAVRDGSMRDKIFLVGGAVRNLFFGIPSKDFDYIISDRIDKRLIEKELESMLPRKVFEEIDYVNDEGPFKRMHLGFDPYFTVDRLILKFDEHSDDPFIDDYIGGYDDLVNHRARMKGTFNEFSIFKSMPRVVWKMIRFNLLFTSGTKKAMDDFFVKARDLSENEFDKNFIDVTLAAVEAYDELKKVRDLINPQAKDVKALWEAIENLAKFDKAEELSFFQMAGVHNSVELLWHMQHPRQLVQEIIINNDVSFSVLDSTGGIDFNAENMNITTRGGEIDFEIPVDMQNINLENIEGLIPVIINIVPVTNVYQILGLSQGRGVSA